MKNTKLSLWISGVIVLSSTCVAPAALVVNGDWTVNTAIPDGSPVGITSYQTFNNLAANGITDVSVNLNISGGYNGDLVGYLTLQDANGNVATEFLLNQVGTSPSNPFGSSGAGFNVTLSDSGTANGSIHNATGTPTGTWLPDSASTLDGTFGGLTANGTWTLFLADMSEGGGTSTLNSWGLEINVAPEPATYGVLAGAGVLVLSFLGRFRRKQD
jgi:hypothetical protein